MERDYCYDENENYCNELENEPGWHCYDEYGGYMGYDDFTINAAFDGEPEAVWNIE